MGQPNRSLKKKKKTLPSKQTNSFIFAKRDIITWAEIIWALHICNKHTSHNSYAEVGYIFQTIFMNCDITKKVTLGSKKMSHNATYLWISAIFS